MDPDRGDAVDWCDGMGDVVRDVPGGREGEGMTCKWAFRRRNKIGRKRQLWFARREWNPERARVRALRDARSKRRAWRGFGVSDVANRRADRSWMVPGREVLF
jgi:hypothetical protein